jgi:hypothetical protein
MIAIFAELAMREIDPVSFFGDSHKYAREMADLELPDYDYLPRVPDWLLRQQARSDVAEALLTGTMFDDIGDSL